MPLIRIDMIRGKSPEHRAAVRDTIYDTLRDVVGVLACDRHEVITECEPDNLNIAPEFFGVRRSSDAILVQITLNEGHTIEQKQGLYVAIVEALHRRVGLRREDVIISLVDVKRENWSFGNGMAHYVDSSPPVNANRFNAVWPVGRPVGVPGGHVESERRHRAFALLALMDELSERYGHGWIGSSKPPAARWRTAVVLVNGPVVGRRHCQREHKE